MYFPVFRRKDTYIDPSRLGDGAEISESAKRGLQIIKARPRKNLWPAGAGPTLKVPALL